MSGNGMGRRRAMSQQKGEREIAKLYRKQKKLERAAARKAAKHDLGAS
jgi:hypothetical protein